MAETSHAETESFTEEARQTEAIITQNENRRASVEKAATRLARGLLSPGQSPNARIVETEFMTDKYGRSAPEEVPIVEWDSIGIGRVDSSGNLGQYYANRHADVTSSEAFNTGYMTAILALRALSQETS